MRFLAQHLKVQRLLVLKKSDTDNVEFVYAVVMATGVCSIWRTVRTRVSAVADWRAGDHHRGSSESERKTCLQAGFRWARTSARASTNPPMPCMRKPTIIFLRYASLLRVIKPIDRKSVHYTYRAFTLSSQLR